MSDISRVYTPGSEPARGGQDLARVAVNGRELANTGNAALAVSEIPGREKSK
jgi:hypothetical protein